ncbi:protein kinase domain-containing protein [Sorangium sp. So ce1151]|uniref:serine/threonine-protein kinase n=1 Tax=Sorangium sp. So ce1151 TaxID=3133332 RepID=UPI003F5EF3C0
MMDKPVRPGDVLLDKYRVERVLGQGGMGVVVAAQHLELGELFAIKFLLPRAIGSPDAVGRFMREARAAARIRSEHVVKVHDVGRLGDGAPYMIMEHLVGSDLAALLRRRGALPLEEATALVLQACDGVAEAHALGIIHRDLKPANLFLSTRRKGSPWVKVLDFGISKQTLDVPIDEQASDTPLHVQTETGAIMGSLFYMSPEQVIKPKDVGPPCDIWAMGIVLYELTTGKLPFVGESLGELVQHILLTTPEPPSKVRPELPAALDAVVMRCLSKLPAARYASIEELASAMRSLLAASSVPPRPIAMDAADSSTMEGLASTREASGAAAAGSVIEDPAPLSTLEVLAPAPAAAAAGAAAAAPRFHEPDVPREAPSLPSSTQASLSTTIDPRRSSHRRSIALVAGAGVVAIGLGAMLGVLPREAPGAAGEPPSPAANLRDATATVASSARAAELLPGSPAATSEPSAPPVASPVAPAASNAPRAAAPPPRAGTIAVRAAARAGAPKPSPADTATPAASAKAGTEKPRDAMW